MTTTIALVFSLAALLLSLLTMLTDRRFFRRRTRGLTPEAEAELAALLQKQGSKPNDPTRYGYHDSDPDEYESDPGAYDSDPDECESDPGAYDNDPDEYVAAAELAAVRAKQEKRRAMTVTVCAASPLAPGQTTTLRQACQFPFFAQRLVVAQECSRHHAIVDIRIAQQSQFAEPQSVPGAAFSPDSGLGFTQTAPAWEVSIAVMRLHGWREWVAYRHLRLPHHNRKSPHAGLGLLLLPPLQRHGKADVPYATRGMAAMKHNGEWQDLLRAADDLRFAGQVWLRSLPIRWQALLLAWSRKGPCWLMGHEPDNGVPWDFRLPEWWPPRLAGQWLVIGKGHCIHCGMNTDARRLLFKSR